MCFCVLVDTATIMPTVHRSASFRRSRDTTRIVIATILGMIFGFLFGISFPSVSIAKIYLPSSLTMSQNITAIMNKIDTESMQKFNIENGTETLERAGSADVMKIFVASNPRGAEPLPPGIIVSETDLFLRRLWGEPGEDIKKKPKYLVTFTVGLAQKDNINAAVKKFSDDFQIMLFHYDGRTSEWNEYEWSHRAIHVSVKKQTKWWYAKRFLHPDIVAVYEYIFIWDEDLGVEHFDPVKYIALVEKHGLEISQPGLEPRDGLTWEMTKKRDGIEVHKYAEEKPGYCAEAHLPPCAAFVEIMAPVFSTKTWRCVWHMIQNDLVHGWGLDFALRRCVHPSHKKIGVVDAQWVVHQVIPSLGNQGEQGSGKAPWEGVRERCKSEWAEFQNRLNKADKQYYSQIARV